MDDANREQTFRERIFGMADQYDQVADSISMRVQSDLKNISDKRSRVERKMAKLNATANTDAADEGSKPDAALDMSVLESETTRIQIYDKQILTLKN